MTTEEQAVSDWLKRWRRKKPNGRCVDAMLDAPGCVEVIWGAAWAPGRGMLHCWGLWRGQIVDPTARQIRRGAISYAELLGDDGRPLSPLAMGERLRAAERLCIVADDVVQSTDETVRRYVGRAWIAPGEPDFVQLVAQGRAKYARGAA